MSLLDKEFKADRLNVRNLKLNGIDISNFQIETLGDGKYVDSLRGDIQVQITPSMLDANGNYVIQQIPGMGRFKKVEVSFNINAVFYISPNGSDLNDGKTPQTPLKGLTKVTNGSYVILLNGTYSDITYLSGYESTLTCLYPSRDNIKIIGESKTGVILQVRKVNSARDWPIFRSCAGATLFNVTIDYNVGTLDNYMCSFARHTSGVLFDNVTFNIVGTYSLIYTEGSTATYNNCLFNGGSRLAPYNGTFYITNNSTTLLLGMEKYSPNIILDGTSLLAYNTQSLDYLSNVINLKTDNRIFTTINLDLWLEQ